MTAEEIEREVREKVKKALENMAQDIADDMATEYSYAIDAFYADYTPKPYGYHRNYFTYDGYQEHIKVTDDYTEAGIKVSSDYTNASYKDPVNYVFNRTYLSGIHGTMETGGRMSPSPKILMKISFDKIRRNIGSYVLKYL